MNGQRGTDYSVNDEDEEEDEDDEDEDEMDVEEEVVVKKRRGRPPSKRRRPVDDDDDDDDEDDADTTVTQDTGRVPKGATFVWGRRLFPFTKRAIVPKRVSESRAHWYSCLGGISVCPAML